MNRLSGIPILLLLGLLASPPTAPGQRAAVMENAGYLGVASSPAPAAMREQLALGRGIGLVVDLVELDSPADRAGIKRFDVLEKLDDQFLINVPQFSVLIRAHRAGDVVKLAVIRQGKRSTLEATLIEKQLPPLEQLHAGMTEPLPPELMRLWHGPVSADGSMSVHIEQGDCDVNWSDPQHTLRLRSRTTDGKKDQQLLVRDSTGKILFDGPVNTDAQRRELDPDVLAKLHRLEKAAGTPAGIGFDPPASTQPER